MEPPSNGSMSGRRDRRFVTRRDVTVRRGLHPAGLPWMGRETERSLQLGAEPGRCHGEPNQLLAVRGHERRRLNKRTFGVNV